MIALVRLRSLLLLAAGGVAACAGGPTPRRDVAVTAGERTTVALQTYRGPLLTLHNESAVDAADVYSSGADPLLKVVPDAELQALLDAFSEQQMFAHSLPRAPGDARDVLLVAQGDRRWIWARRGSDVDPREAAFRSGRSYFLALYNGNTAYHGAAGGVRPDFEGAAARARANGGGARQR